MNKQEVIEEIKSQVTDKNQDPDYDADFSKLKAAGFEVKEIDREGGTDQGSEYFAILRVTHPEMKDIFVKCDAYYQSYHGAEWGDGDTYEVEKKEVVVSEWAKV